MTKYRVSFEVESVTSSDIWNTNIIAKHTKSLRAFISDGKNEYVTVPISAEIEEISEPEFKPAWYGCFKDGELQFPEWVNTSEDLAWFIENYVKPGTTFEPVSIAPREPTCKAAEPEFTEGNLVRVKHSFEYNPHAGKLGKIVYEDPKWLNGQYRVKFQNTGTVAYFNADQLEKRYDF